MNYQQQEEKQVEDTLTMDCQSKGNFRDGSSISLRSVTAGCCSVRLSNITAIFEDSNKDRSLNKLQKYSDCSHVLS
jgi:hypothetical protein